MFPDISQGKPIEAGQAEITRCREDTREREPAYRNAYQRLFDFLDAVPAERPVQQKNCDADHDQPQYRRAKPSQPVGFLPDRSALFRGRDLHPWFYPVLPQRDAADDNGRPGSSFATTTSPITISGTISGNAPYRNILAQGMAKMSGPAGRQRGLPL